MISFFTLRKKLSSYRFAQFFTPCKKLNKSPICSSIFILSMNSCNTNRNIDSKKLLRCECSCLYFPATFVVDIGKIGLLTLSGLLSSYNDCLRGLQTFSLSFVKSHYCNGMLDEKLNKFSMVKQQILNFVNFPPSVIKELIMLQNNISTSTFKQFLDVKKADTYYFSTFSKYMLMKQVVCILPRLLFIRENKHDNGCTFRFSNSYELEQCDRIV